MTDSLTSGNYSNNGMGGWCFSVMDFIQSCGGSTNSDTHNTKFTNCGT